MLQFSSASVVSLQSEHPCQHQHHHEGLRSRDRSLMFRNTVSNPQRSLSRQVMFTLIHALAISKVDYCNSVLVGVHAECRRVVDILSKETITHKSTAP